MITWNEIRSILRSVLRWWWLCILAVVLSGGTAYYITQQETRYYVAREVLMVGNALGTARPDQYQISISSSLARFYAELARRGRILQPVQQRLQLPFAWELISDNMLTTNVVPSAPLLELYVTDSDPQRAAAIASAIGNELVSYSPSSPEKIQAEQQALEQQLTDSQQRIDEIKAKLDVLTARQKSATSASDLSEINQTVVELNTSLEREQNTYSSLLGYKNNSATNSMSVFEPAVPPTAPLPSKRLLTIAVASCSGLLLALAAIYLLEQLDTGWRRPRDVEERFKLENLGTIPAGPPLLAALQPFTELRFQAVREVQTNILLASQGVRTLLISSPYVSEARTAFSIDLADLFGRSGHRVLVVDSDSSNSFLTKMLAPQGAPHVWTMMSGNGNGNLWANFFPTPLANVALLPQHHDMNGSPALLPSLRWRELVESLLTSADIIIFDGPNVLSGPDAALLAPHVDGVVLTLDPTKDNGEGIARSRERLLGQPGLHLLGAVTFTPSEQPQNARSWKRLRGQQQPALPLPEWSTANANSAPFTANQKPIITPPPSDSIAVDSHREPLITPPHADPLAGSASVSSVSIVTELMPEPLVPDDNQAVPTVIAEKPLPPGYAERSLKKSQSTDKPPTAQTGSKRRSRRK